MNFQYLRSLLFSVFYIYLSILAKAHVNLLYMKCNTCTFNIYWKVWIEISKSRLMTWSDQNPKSWHLKSQISSSIENLFQSKPIKVSRVEFQSGSWLFVGLSADKKDNSCRQYILGEEYRGMLKPLTPTIVAKVGR